jgi:hypothetical protein
MDRTEMAPVQALKEKTPVTIPNLENRTPDPTIKRSRKTGKKNKGHLPPQTPIQWTNSHQEMLHQLIDAPTKPPVLGYPDFTQTFVLHYDTSQVDLGAVVYQRQQGKMLAPTP